MRFHPLLALALALVASVVPNAEATAAAAAAATADPSSPSPPSLLTVHEGFLSSEEISSLLRDVELDSLSSGTYYGPAVLPPSIARRLRDLAGTGTCAPQGRRRDDDDGEDGEGEGSAGVAVMTMLMEETTDLHRDCHVPQSEGRVVEDDVAFVFLSSNPRAAFVHGDDIDGDDAVDSVSRVEVEAGSLVQFRGSAPHRTVVPPGSSPVRIAGPFHLRSMKYVGSCQESCETASDCTGGAFFAACRCADGRLLREEAKERAMRRLGDLEAELADLEAESSARRGFLRHVVNNPREDQDQGQGRELQACLGRCVEAKGACVFQGGSCYDNMTPHLCGPTYVGNGGVFQGGSSTCANDLGIPNVGGACCFSGRKGFRSSPGYCEIMTPGFYVGDGTNYPADCPSTAEYGACCSRDGCKLLPSSSCSSRGGVFKGVGSTCEADCEGACCGGTAGCEIVTETGAMDADSTCDGTFQGTDTDCFFDGCPAKCEAAFQGATNIAAPAEGQVVLTPGDTTGADNYKDTFPVCDDPILTAGGKWYNLDVAGGRRVTVSTCGGDVAGAEAGHDTVLSIYTGSDNCSDVECVEEAEGSGDSPNCRETGGSTYSWCVPGDGVVTYRIYVHGYTPGSCSLAEGPFTLGVRDDGPCASTTTTTATTTATTMTASPTTTNTTTTPTTATTMTATATTATTTTTPTTTTTTTATAMTATPTTTTTTTTPITTTTTTTTTTTCPQKPLGDASDYNIFIKNDFNPTAADACKAVAVGGDASLPTGWSAGFSQNEIEFPGPETDYTCSKGQTLRLTFYAEGNVDLPSSGSITGGLVAGSINGGGAAGEKGSPSSFTPFSVTDCAVVLDDPAQPGLGPTLPDIDGTFVELEALSQELKSYTDEPPVEIGVGGVLTLDASGQGCGLKAFNVDIADVANIGYSVQIKLIGSPSCGDDTFLINWLGAGTFGTQQLSAYYSLTDVDETRVFNNFPDATALTLGSVDWRGAFLAPKADIDAKSGAVWSQIVAKSWTGDAEIECGDFLGNFCP